MQFGSVFRAMQFYIITRASRKSLHPSRSSPERGNAQKKTTAMNRNTIILAKATNGTPEILVYGYIDGDMATDFAKQIKALEQTCNLINVRINSDGGSVYNGIAMFNCIRTAKCAIDIYIDGIAASMASAIAMAGRKVYMSRFARLMTHKPSGYGGGSADELRQVADEIDALEPILNEFYCHKTGLTPEEVTARFLNGKDNFFGAVTALAAKLIDGIYDGQEIDLPETADLKAVYEAFQTKLTASLSDTSIINQNPNTDMRQISATAWATICATMGITDSVDDAAVVSAIKKLSKDAAQLPTVQAKLDTATTALNDFKKETSTKEITAMLDGAFGSKKINAKQKEIFARQYADDSEGLKEVLDSLGAFVSVNTVINQTEKNGVRTPEVMALVAKGYDALMQSGEMATLKSNCPEAYLELYKGFHGYLPGEKPAPKRG